MSLNRALLSFCLFALAASGGPALAQVTPAAPAAPYISCGPQCIEFGLLLDMEREQNQTRRSTVPTAEQATTSGSATDKAVVTDRRDAVVGR
jgi:hypothetical protein